MLARLTVAPPFLYADAGDASSAGGGQETREESADRCEELALMPPAPGSGTHEPPARATSSTACASRLRSASNTCDGRRQAEDPGQPAARVEHRRRDAAEVLGALLAVDREAARRARASSSASSARGRVTVCSVKRREPARHVALERRRAAAARARPCPSPARAPRAGAIRVPSPGMRGDALAAADVRDLDRAALDHAEVGALARAAEQLVDRVGQARPARVPSAPGSGSRRAASGGSARRRAARRSPRRRGSPAGGRRSRGSCRPRPRRGRRARPRGARPGAAAPAARSARWTALARPADGRPRLGHSHLGPLSSSP